jgi:outer membrane protein assembly factor BamE (lipoprotein component of BamABCDE complex)
MSPSSHVFLSVVLLVTSTSVRTEGPEVGEKSDSVTAKHRYAFGDNDSKSDATRICLLEAKRKAIEYAGVYIESTMKVTESEKSRDATQTLSTVAAAMVEAEMTSSSVSLSNEQMFIDCEVVVKVDRSRIAQDMERRANDPKVVEQLTEQQEKLTALESEIQRLKTQFQAAPRQDVASYEVVSNRAESKGSDARRLVAKGMNQNDVSALLGQPAATSLFAVKTEQGISINSSDRAWNYGMHWVLFTGGIVRCVLTQDEFMARALCK